MFTMTEIERAILEHCRRPGGASLSSLKRFKDTAKHAAAKRLAGRGLLEHVRHGVWRTTDAGIRFLEEPVAASEDPITAMWPPLATLPHEALKSDARLVALAVVARTRGLATSHLPSFFVFGRTLSGKTTFGKVECYTFGVVPDRGVINATAEAGKSVGVRRTATGAVRTMREAMTWPVVVFDEVHRAPPEVRRAMLPYLAGERRVPYENETLDIVATSIVLLNPLAPKEAGLEKRTGFDETLLRRSIPLDLEGLPLGAVWRTEGPRILEAAARAAPIRFPEGVAAVPVVREDVARALDRIVRPEYVRWVDIEMIYVLCVAASSIGIVDPVMYVVTNYATVVETVGWVRDGWREALRHREKTNPAPTGFEPSPLGQQVIAMAGNEATVTFEANTAAFDRLCDALGLSRDQVVARLRTDVTRDEQGLTDAVMDEILRLWERSGRDPQETAECIGSLVDTYGTLTEANEKTSRELRATRRQYDALLKAAEERGGFDVIKRADPLLKMMERLGFELHHAEAFLKSFLAAPSAQGLSEKEAGERAFAIAWRHKNAQQVVVEHEQRMAFLKSEIVALEGKARDLEARAVQAVAVLEAAEARRRTADDEAADLASKTGTLKAAFEALQEDLKEAMGSATTVQDAVHRAAERENAAAAVVARCDARERALDAREKGLDEKEATLVMMEEDVDAGRAAQHVLWGEFGAYGNPSARAFERLARWSKRGKAPIAWTGLLDANRFRNGLLRLAGPHIEKWYVLRREHEREIEHLRAQVAAKDAALAAGKTAATDPEKKREGSSVTGPTGSV